MPNLMWLAAALMALTTGAHLFAGTPEIMWPIQAAELAPEVIATAMVVWHLVTLLLILLTIGLAYLARNSNGALWHFMIAIQLGTAALFLFYTLTTFDALFTLPQWTVFLLVPVLMIVARPKAV